MHAPMGYIQDALETQKRTISSVWIKLGLKGPVEVDQADRDRTFKAEGTERTKPQQHLCKAQETPSCQLRLEPMPLAENEDRMVGSTSSCEPCIQVHSQKCILQEIREVIKIFQQCFLFKITAMLTYYSDTIKFTTLKCTNIQCLLVYSQLFNHHHSLILEHFNYAPKEKCHIHWVL